MGGNSLKTEKCYTEFTDTELIEEIKKGDIQAQEFIINKYKALVKEKTRTFFIAGADHDDLIQEGMIGLLKATVNFKPEKNVSFQTFADLCITRQIITAIRTAGRKKNIPLNSYISIYKKINDSNESVLETLTDNKFRSPEDFLISKENKSFMENYINDSFSEMECKVLSLYLTGKSYQEIGKILDKNEKSIDNAIQRIRKKLEKALNKNNQDMHMVEL